MKFQLSVQMPLYPFRLRHEDRIFFMGSCFSENISEMMSQHGFFVTSNPWGILFNPVSLARLTEKLIHPENIDDAVIPVFREKRWFSLHQHSRICSESESEIYETVEQITLQAAEDFQSSDALIVTFGSAFVYEYLDGKNEIVANCQKLPSGSFCKRLLEIDEIVEIWSKCIQEIKGKKIIFTISPVRHSKDGLIENNQSKSVLILAIKKLLKIFPEKCFYFPAYEIVIDELRDYRFFEEDMVHPALISVKYVWEKWCQCFYDHSTIEMAIEFNKLYLFSRHRPLYGDVELHRMQAFNMMKKCELCYPNMNYSVIFG